ncbi:MAG: glycosyltransferase family 4 protein [Acidobacteriia bacterium]|nr:glycosyltransferase family 4 protein [Terriglobia bacterium]
MVNGFCAYCGESSWAIHGRYFFDALDKQEEVRIVSWNGPPAGPVPGARPAFGRPILSNPSIGFGPIEHVATIVGSRRIALIPWETTIIPSEKVRMFRSMDEVWALSSWGRQILINNGVDANKIGIVPAGVDVQKFRPKSRLERAARPFRFLSVGKWEVRKGTDDLVRAYCAEFHPEEAVELVLHCSNAFVSGFDLEANIRRIAGERHPSIVGSHPVTTEALVDLYNSCDAFVLPTRGEGWGMPVTEAMACGLPVIVTKYSAPLDYLNEDCGYFIPVEELVPVCDSDFFPGESTWGEWAQPDLQSLRRLMRQVFEHPSEARKKGELARLEVCNRWTWDHAAASAVRLLSRSG